MLTADWQPLSLRLGTASVALWLCTSVGCGRLGYEPVALPANPLHDVDAGLVAGGDARIDTQVAVSPTDSMPGATPEGGAVDMQPVALADAANDSAATIPNITLPYTQDFESPESNWSVRSPGQASEATRSTVRRRTGAASLQCVKGSAPGGRYLETRLDKPLTSGEIYSRVFIYAPRGWAVADWLVPMEMKGLTAHDGKFSFDINRTDYGVNLSTGSSRLVPGTIARDRWVCVELGLGLSATNGWSRLFIDGALVVEGTKENTLLNAADPGVQRFRIGIIAAPVQREVEIYFDDWAISTSYIGCGN